MLNYGINIPIPALIMQTVKGSNYKNKNTVVNVRGINVKILCTLHSLVFEYLSFKNLIEQVKKPKP